MGIHAAAEESHFEGPDIIITWCISNFVVESVLFALRDRREHVQEYARRHQLPLP